MTFYKTISRAKRANFVTDVSDFGVYRLIKKNQKINPPLKKRFKDVLDHIFIFWNMVFFQLLIITTVIEISNNHFTELGC